MRSVYSYPSIVAVSVFGNPYLLIDNKIRDIIAPYLYNAIDKLTIWSIHTHTHTSYPWPME